MKKIQAWVPQSSHDSAKDLNYGPSLVAKLAFSGCGNSQKAPFHVYMGLFGPSGHERKEQANES